MEEEDLNGDGLKGVKCKPICTKTLLQFWNQNNKLKVVKLSLKMWQVQ